MLKNIWYEISLVILSSIIVGGSVYFWYNSKIEECFSSFEKDGWRNQQEISAGRLEAYRLSNQLADTQKDLSDMTSYYENLKHEKEISEQGYKMFYILGLKSEVPKDWSVFRIPEAFGSEDFYGLPTAAIARDSVLHGDIGWDQVNLYFVGKDIVDRSVQDLKDDPNSRLTWSIETIGGATAEVATHPLNEQGLADKGNTGGKQYFIKLPEGFTYGIKTLKIWKQAKGDEEFEREFQRFIEKIELTK